MYLTVFAYNGNEYENEFKSTSAALFKRTHATAQCEKLEMNELFVCAPYI